MKYTLFKLSFLFVALIMCGSAYASSPWSNDTSSANIDSIQEPQDTVCYPLCQCGCRDSCDSLSDVNQSLSEIENMSEVDSLAVQLQPAGEMNLSNCNPYALIAAGAVMGLLFGGVVNLIVMFVKRKRNNGKLVSGKVKLSAEKDESFNRDDVMCIWLTTDGK